MKKSTQELLNELKQTTDVFLYLDTNQAELYDMQLKDYLEQMLQEKNISKAEAIQRSNLHQIYAYQIFSGKKQPSRDKLLALAFGLSLDLTQTQRLLRLAKVSELYSRDRRDCLIIFAINQELSILDCNALLYESEEYTLS